MPVLVSPASYSALYPALVAAAREHGYALAIHGSMTRDFDLLAVPWIEGASEAIDLVRALKDVCAGVFVREDMDEFFTDGNPSEKPHGRKAWSIHLTNEGCAGPYLDVSVMPKTTVHPPDVGV